MVVESAEPGCLFTKFLHATRARKDDKNRQNTLFLLNIMKLVPNKQLLLNFLFQPTKNTKKRFVCGQQNTRGYWRSILSNM